MKECAHVWISVNYLTQPPHTHEYTIPRDILLARCCSTCLFLSVCPSLLLLSISHFLLNTLVENYKVKTTFFSGSKHLSGLAWDQQLS